MYVRARFCLFDDIFAVAFVGGDHWSLVYLGVCKKEKTSLRMQTQSLTKSFLILPFP